MSALTPLGDPDALVCDGDVCAIPGTNIVDATGAAATSAAERAENGQVTPDR